MKVFPERDGNGEKKSHSKHGVTVRPNEGLP